jgi:hypothetical protein
MIRHIGAIAALALAAPLAAPAQAQGLTYRLSVACNVSVNIVSPTVNAICTAGRDGAQVRVPAGQIVTLVADGKVASWTGCTTTTTVPDYTCTVKMAGNVDVTNVAPVKASPAPAPAATGGSGIRS